MMRWVPLHEDADKTFDHKLPLDALQGSESRWPIFVAGWAGWLLLGWALARWLTRGDAEARRWRLPLFLAFASLTPSVRDGGLAIVVIAAFGAWVVLGRSVGGALGGLARRTFDAWMRPSPRAFGWRLFLGAFVGYALLGWICFRWVPTIQDSQAQLFQARLLSRGALVAPLPPGGPAFLAENMIMRGASWYSIYPLGHVISLTLGVLVGAPFLVNPLLGALTVVLVTDVGRRVFDEKVARLAALFALLSPFHAYMSSEYMNHATCGAMLSLELWALVRWTTGTRTVGRALGLGALGGVGLGMAAMTRPLTMVAVNLAIGAFLVASLVSAAHRSERGTAGGLVGLGAAMAIVAAGLFSLQMGFNTKVNGSPLLFGHTILFPTMKWGFVHGPWGDHTPFRAVEFTFRNVDAVNLYMVGAPIPGLILAIFGAWSHRDRPLAMLLAGIFVATLGLYAGFCFQDLTFGPRYVYEATLATYPLAAAGLPIALDWLGKTKPEGDARRATRAGAALLGVALSLATIFPGLGFYYRKVYGLDDGVVAVARRTLPSGSLLLVQPKYQRAFWAVDPALTGPVLFARHLSSENDRALVCAMPDRRAFIEREGDGALVPLSFDCRREPR